MKVSEIKTEAVYQIKNNPCFFKVIKLLKPNEEENTNNYAVVKGEWSRDKDFTFGVIRYFRPIDLTLVE